MDPLIKKREFDANPFLNLTSDQAEFLSGSPSTKTVLYVAVTIAVLTYWFNRKKIQVPNAPFITPKSIWDFQWRDAKLKFQVDCKNIVSRGFQMVRPQTAEYATIQADQYLFDIGRTEAFSCHLWPRWASGIASVYGARDSKHSSVQCWRFHERGKQNPRFS